MKKSELRQIIREEISKLKTESFWINTTDYDPNDDDQKTWFQTSGVPGSSSDTLEKLNQMLINSKGKITQQIVSWAERNIRSSNRGALLKTWLKSHVDKTLKQINKSSEDYLSY